MLDECKTLFGPERISMDKRYVPVCYLVIIIKSLSCDVFDILMPP